MKITKAGLVIPFKCDICKCEFQIGVMNLASGDYDGNLHIDCPCCGSDCYTDAPLLSNEYYEAVKFLSEFADRYVL